MKKQVLALLVFSVILVLFAASCSGGNSGSSLYPNDGKPDAAEIFAEECSKCHALDLVKQVSYDVDQWETAVDRMVIKGAVLNDEEKAIVTEYLIDKYTK